MQDFDQIPPLINFTQQNLC